MSAQPKLELLEAQVEDGLGALIGEAERRLTELRTLRAKVELEISVTEAKLGVWHAARRSLNGERHLAAVPRTKREAVLRLLGEHPFESFRLVAIREMLVERGWMVNDKNGRHALEVAVRNMEKRGELTRVETGVYKLVPPTTDGTAHTSESDRQHPGEGRLGQPPLPDPSVESATVVVERTGL